MYGSMCIFKMFLQVQLYYGDVFNDRNSVHVLYLHLFNPFQDNDGNCQRLLGVTMNKNEEIRDNIQTAYMNLKYSREIMTTVAQLLHQSLN